MYQKSCGWCGKEIRDEEVALVDEKLFHTACVVNYINYCRMLREICLKEMKGVRDVLN